MAQGNDYEYVTVLPKDGPLLQGWDTSMALDLHDASALLARAILFGKAQSALEAVAAGGASLTSDHAKALHYANELAELNHHGPLIGLEDDLPVLAPGVRELIGMFPATGVWEDGRPWDL